MPIARGPGAPARAIGIDEILIRKGHVYRIVVSDLVRKRPIWFGGEDRSETSMAQFYAWLGRGKCSRIRLVVMDMWKPFRNVAMEMAPQAAILFDKFHIMRHLGEALDKVRKAEYARVGGKDRRFIKGQKYTLLSRREKSLSGRQALARTAAGRQQAPQHRLRPEGVLRPTVDLPARELGPPFLRQLAREPEMATSQTLRALCRNDRSALGRNRRLLQTREQSLTRFRRGPQQQDPSVSATRIRPERRGISPPKRPLLHAPAHLNPPKSPTRFPEDPQNSDPAVDTFRAWRGAAEHLACDVVTEVEPRPRRPGVRSSSLPRSSASRAHARTGR